MKIEEFAHTLLFGQSLEDKLTPLQEGTDVPRRSALAHPPVFPGRPPKLARIGKAEFPELASLSHATARGRLLHFFANHELLAMELMALMLLKFPEAPVAFRTGIAQTMMEEQNHLRLYLDRMRELGVDFGDLPVSDYFWKSIKDMSSPLQFVTQMSLTLEQANLDFSLYYRDAVAHVGDEKTAAVLDQVYREEIGHVKHGLTWFNRWRKESHPEEDDWDAYLRLLPSPMTPRRAKGLSFSADSRRQVGLSERFIREIEVYAGSKGRPPVFWLYNPLCDAEIVRGKPGLSPPEPVRRLGLDLETLPMYLASDKDIVLVHEIPRAEWLRELQALGFETPEFRKRSAAPPREAKIGGLQPWGWSPETFAQFKPWRDRLVKIEGGNGLWSAELLANENFAKTGLGEFFSKTWSQAYLRSWLVQHPEDQSVFGSLETLGGTYMDWESVRTQLPEKLATGPYLAKAPWGTSGMQNKRILNVSELEGPLGGWIRNLIEAQGAVLLEPELDKLADLSMQIEVRDEEIKILGIRRFETGSRFEFRGTYLDSKLTSLGPELLQLLHSSALDRWRSLARKLGETLRDSGYRGPAGLDALLWRDADGTSHLRPLIELNPRWTMGRVALALEAQVVPGVPALWIFARAADLDWRKIVADYPIRTIQIGGRTRISEGILMTTDPDKARECLTFLAIGPAATEAYGFTAKR